MVMTCILVVVELIVYYYYGFPNGFMLPIVGIYLSILGLLEAYKRNCTRKNETRRKSGLPKTALAVLEAVHKGFFKRHQIEEYVMERFSLDRVETFEAIAILVKQGYVKDFNGGYSVTEKADDLL